MLTNLRSRARRFTPAVAGVAVLLTGFAALHLGTGSTSAVQGDQTLAAADSAVVNRGDAQAATRGAGRTPESQFPAASAAIVTTTTSTEVPTTTSTTSAPTTTSTSTTAAPPTTTTQPVAAASSNGNSQSGGASYYAYKSGGCAHKTIPKGTTITVTNVSTGKSATCVVNDRGPFASGRIIDLDTSVFKQLASTSQGVFQARITW